MTSWHTSHSTCRSSRHGTSQRVAKGLSGVETTPECPSRTTRARPKSPPSPTSRSGIAREREWCGHLQTAASTLPQRAGPWKGLHRGGATPMPCGSTTTKIASCTTKPDCLSTPVLRKTLQRDDQQADAERGRGRRGHPRRSKHHGGGIRRSQQAPLS